MSSTGRGLVLALVLLAPAFGQSAAFEGKTFAAIEFTPAQPLDSADLAKAVPFKKGDSLRAAEISRSIDALFATGRFEDIVAEAEASGAGVTVRYHVELAWFVGSVAVRGK